MTSADSPVLLSAAAIVGGFLGYVGVVVAARRNQRQPVEQEPAAELEVVALLLAQLELASAKRVRKGVPLMVGNIGPQTFGQDDNALLLIDAQGVTELPRNAKITLARQLIARIAAHSNPTVPQAH